MTKTQENIQYILKHYSQDFLAKYLGITEKSIINYKNGSNPKKETAQLIEETFRKVSEGVNLRDESKAVPQSDMTLKYIAALERENEFIKDKYETLESCYSDLYQKLEDLTKKIDGITANWNGLTKIQRGYSRVLTEILRGVSVQNAVPGVDKKTFVDNARKLISESDGNQQ